MTSEYPFPGVYSCLHAIVSVVVSVYEPPLTTVICPDAPTIAYHPSFKKKSFPTVAVLGSCVP